MTLVRRILLALFVWALALGPGSPLATLNISLFRVQAYAYTSDTYGYDNSLNRGVPGGDADSLHTVSGSTDTLYLQNAYGGTGGYGDDVVAPGQGGRASSELTGLNLGTSSTSYMVQAFGGNGGYSVAGSAADFAEFALGAAP